MSLPKRIAAEIEGKGLFTAIDIVELLNKDKPTEEHITNIQAYSAMKGMNKSGLYHTRKKEKDGFVAIEVIGLAGGKKSKFSEQKRMSLFNQVLFGVRA